jgi:hypothetical protein
VQRLPALIAQRLPPAVAIVTEFALLRFVLWQVPFPLEAVAYENARALNDVAKRG